MNMNELKIATVEELAGVLGFESAEIKSIAENLRPHYYFKQIEKNGKKRLCCVPFGKFRAIQKKLNRNILQKIKLPNIIIGGVPGYSVTANAEMHARKDVVITTDIKDYFPSISSGRVKQMFLNLGASEEVSGVLTGLTTCEGKLPQGFSTSVTIANLVARSMAKRFIGLCSKYGFVCSIWVDDITVSGDFRLSQFEDLIKIIIRQEGFQVKDEKTKVMTKDERQIVTKLTVNHKVNIAKSKKRELRSLIYRCLKYGPKTQTILELDAFRRSLAGKIASAAGINKNTGDKLQQNFNHIIWQ
jgi:RNA-directed DNA polymerase